MKPHELAILRTGLHMTREDLARCLHHPVANVVAWETGDQPIYEALKEEIRLLCESYVTLVDTMRLAVAGDGTRNPADARRLIVYATDEEFWFFHPNHKNLPACLQRAAAFAVVTDAWINEGREIRILDTASIPQ